MASNGNSKVVVYKSHKVASLSLLAHLFPIFGCIVLLYFNLGGYYIGSELTGLSGQDSAKVNALQFAAKVHEMTMVSSLTVIISTMLRRKVLSGHDVPLSTLVAGFEFTQVHFLWSRELWGSIKQIKASCGRYLVASLILATVLVPLVGPASAVLMIPRMGDWDVGGTEFYLNSTHDEIWPAILDASNVPEHCIKGGPGGPDGDLIDRSCPAGGWEALKSGYAALVRNETEVPESERKSTFFSDLTPFPIPGKYSLTAMTVDSRATTAQLCISDALLQAGRLWTDTVEYKLESFSRPYHWRQKSTFFIEKNSLQTRILQPWTGVHCEAQEIATNASDASEVAILLRSPTDMNKTVSQTYPILADLLNRTSPSVHFIDSPEQLGASAAAIVVLPGDALSPSRDPVDGHRNTTVMGCSISARWTGSYPFIENTRDRERTWTVQNEIHDMSRPDMRPEDDKGPATPIKIKPAWATYLNPTATPENRTVFEELVYASNVAGDPTRPNTTEHLLSAMTTNGLARIGYNAVLQGTLPDPSHPERYEEILPKGFFGPGGQIWNTDNVDTSGMFHSAVKVKLKGYGYGPESKTVYAAVAILLLYCLFAIPHVIIIAASGISYMWWDSIMELTTLAIQSERTTALDTATAGITGTAVYKVPVKVRAVENHIELLFKDTDKDGELVKENTPYY
ncbi:hypothetical protein ACO1O0_009403 [Amphichorda felina]